MNDKELMTLYAGLAMQGLLAARHEVSPMSIARVAFEVAEAMIKEQTFREETNERVRPTQGD
jgi:hypothetical protein